MKMGPDGDATQRLDLAAFAGIWRASGTLIFSPVQPPAPLAGTAMLELALAGAGLVERFEGACAGKPYARLCTWDLDGGAVRGSWRDTMSTQIVQLAGTAGATLAAAGHYDGGGGDWTWRTELVREGAALRYRAWNAAPASLPLPPTMPREHLAMDLVLTAAARDAAASRA